MQSGLTVPLCSVPISQMIRIKEEKMEGRSVDFRGSGVK